MDQLLENESFSFHSRGIGLDNTPGCFVCGGNQDLYNNMAAFVQTKDEGEKVAKIFQTGARLDYRPSEPNWIQVKIGACKKHLPNLERLDYFCSDGRINLRKVSDAMTLRPVYEANGTATMWRHGRVDILSRILRHDLRIWAQASAQRAKDRGEIEIVPTYPITILYANGGYTRQLIYGDNELICALHEWKDKLMVDLFLAKKMPVGPWDVGRVVELFNAAQAKDVIVPQGIVMPKITQSSIEPSDGVSKGERGFDLNIKFDKAPFGRNDYEEQTNLVSEAMNTGLDSWDCCHFFTSSVVMFFPTLETAQNALSRVQKVCQKL